MSPADVDVNRVLNAAYRSLSIEDRLLLTEWVTEGLNAILRRERKAEQSGIYAKMGKSKLQQARENIYRLQTTVFNQQRELEKVKQEAAKFETQVEQFKALA